MMDVNKFKSKSKLSGRYEKQLKRLQANGIATDCIETAIKGAVENLKRQRNHLSLFTANRKAVKPR
jgi:hypothetical protein